MRKNTPCHKLTKFPSTVLLVALAFAFFIGERAWTNVEFDANQLRMKNSDEIGALVRKKLKRAQDIQAKQTGDDGTANDPEALDQLKDAMRIVLSRPDQDGSRSNAFARLRRELVDMYALDQVLGELNEEAIQALKNSSTSASHQFTYIVLLEGLMAEIKPEIGSSPAFKKMIENIRDAKIKVSEQARKQQLLRSMAQPVSPSDTAAKILSKK